MSTAAGETHRHRANTAKAVGIKTLHRRTQVRHQVGPGPRPSHARPHTKAEPSEAVLAPRSQAPHGQAANTTARKKTSHRQPPAGSAPATPTMRTCSSNYLSSTNPEGKVSTRSTPSATVARDGSRRRTAGTTRTSSTYDLAQSVPHAFPILHRRSGPHRAERLQHQLARCVVPTPPSISHLGQAHPTERPPASPSHSVVRLRQLLVRLQLWRYHNTGPPQASLAGAFRRRGHATVRIVG